MLQRLHRRVCTASHPASVLALLATTASLVLARVEVCTSKVGCRIVVGAIRLLHTTVLAVGEEGPVGIGFLTDPHFTNALVLTLNMTA